MDPVVEKLKKFGESLKTDDWPPFEDLMRQLDSRPLLKWNSVIREMPMILTILFLHQKELTELHKMVLGQEALAKLARERLKQENESTILPSPR